jgi:hypothetical protein
MGIFLSQFNQILKLLQYFINMPKIKQIPEPVSGGINPVIYADIASMPVLRNGLLTGYCWRIWKKSPDSYQGFINLQKTLDLWIQRKAIYQSAISVWK